MSQQAPQPVDNSGFIIFLVVTLGILFLFTYYGASAAKVLLKIAAVLALPLAPVSSRCAAVARQADALDPEKIGLGGAWDILCIPAEWYVWCLCIPCAAFLVVKQWKLSPADLYRRSLSMKKLLAANLPFNPCIAPAVNWPGGILKEPLDSGPWAAGRQPLHLAAAYGLLVDQATGKPVPAGELLKKDNLADPDSRWLRTGTRLELDRPKAAAVFAGQMGRKWNGSLMGLVKDAPGERKGAGRSRAFLVKLACAWVFYACEDKKTAQKLLDEMSLSFRGPQKAVKGKFSKKPPFWIPGRKATPWMIDSSISPKLVQKAQKLLEEDKLMLRYCTPHQIWESCYLLAIYEAARTKGVLPTAEFIWLRPLDRRLFYLCNNCGRRTVWPEIAGPWNHYQAETLLNLAEPECTGIEEPQVDEAVNAMEVAMHEEGWIAPGQLSQIIRANSKNLGLDLDKDDGAPQKTPLKR